MSFWGELRRRNIFKVGAAYAIVAWLLIQIAVSVFPVLGLPQWGPSLVTVFLILGFPVALLLAWAYEVTPDGIKPTRQVPLTQSIRHLTGQTLNYIVSGLLALALAFVVIDMYVLTDDLSELTAASQPGGTMQPLMRFDVDLGPGTALAPRGGSVHLAISRDGTQVAYVSEDSDGVRWLHVRPLSDSEPRRLAGTEGARSPFFSPDGQWIAYFDDRNLNRISAEGGAKVVLRPAAGANPNGTWSEDDTIIAADISGIAGPSGLWRMSSAGGSVEPITELDAERGEQTHDWPQFLPQGRAVLFTVGADAGRPSRIDVQALDHGQRKTLLEGGIFGRYLPSGHLVYVSEGTLFAAPMNLDRLELTGSAVPVLGGVSTNAAGGAQVAFSETGTLVYLKETGVEQMMVQWLDGTGRMEPLLSEPGIYAFPRFSPDGARLALQVTTGSNSDIVVYDFERDRRTQLTFSAAVERTPAWSPDSRYIVYASATTGGLYWTRADGSGEPALLIEALNGARLFYPSFSTDGTRLVFSQLNSDLSYEIWMARAAGNDRDPPRFGEPEPLLRDPSTSVIHPALSPDGRWLAYMSLESGTGEVYVTPASPGTAGRGGKWRVSETGGAWPIWSPNGHHLFYRDGDRIMAVRYRQNGEVFEHDRPVLWSEVQGRADIGLQNSYALAPDGERFAVVAFAEGAPVAERRRHVTFVLNFFDELRRRVPVDGAPAQ